MSADTHKFFILAAVLNWAQLIFSLKALPGNEELNDAAAQAKQLLFESELLTKLHGYHRITPLMFSDFTCWHTQSSAVPQ